jgi:uncharacterized protein (TIGR02145 family)
MRLLSNVFILVLVFQIFTTCDRFETNPLTKVRTLAVTAEVVTAKVFGKIIELSGMDNVEYGFCYANHSTPTIDDEVVSLGNPIVGDFSANLTNLTPGELYYIRAFCKDGVTFIYGDALQFSTSSGEVSFKQPEIIFVSPTSSRIKIEIINDGGANITSRGVVWSTSQNPTISNNHTTDGTSIGSWVSIVTNLIPNTLYYIKAYATNVAGTFYSNQLTFVTLQEGTVVDVEGNIYKTITIDNTTWMAENLKVTKYSDGTAIATGLNATGWESATGGAYAIYPHQGISGILTETDMANSYGILYNWYAVSSNQGLCPVGWRVPTDQEWTDVVSYIATLNDQNIGNQLKSCLQVSSPLGGACAAIQHPRWDTDATNFGTNSFGFAALPAGIRYINGTFTNIGIQASWWSATGLGTSSAWYRNIFSNNGSISRSVEDKKLGLSVRCVREWD